MVAKKRWAVVFPEVGKFVVGKSGKLSWTTNRREAAEIAEGFGGEVVDADKYVKEVRQKLR